jgi:hypothetical protein
VPIVIAFVSNLALIARPAGGGAHAFIGEDGSCRGFVQIIWDSASEIVIHRLWTLSPCGGNGSMMLRAVCELADRHGIAIKLKPLPFGRKPYPMNRDQLVIWYQRHGFEGTLRKMIRKPRAIAAMT